MSKKKPLIIINFWRKFTNNPMGHFAPIAGYHPDKESVLILDVASHKIVPHWISISYVTMLMCKVDKITGKPRGYLLVES